MHSIHKLYAPRYVFAIIMNESSLAEIYRFIIQMMSNFCYNQVCWWDHMLTMKQNFTSMENLLLE